MSIIGFAEILSINAINFGWSYLEASTKGVFRSTILFNMQHHQCKTQEVLLLSILKEILSFQIIRKI